MNFWKIRGLCEVFVNKKKTHLLTATFFAVAYFSIMTLYVHISVKQSGLNAIEQKQTTFPDFGPSRLDTSISVDLCIEQRPRVYFLRVAWTRPRGEDITLPTSPRQVVGYTFRPNITADKSGFRKELLVTCEGLIRTVGRISARLEAIGNDRLL